MTPNSRRPGDRDRAGPSESDSDDDLDQALEDSFPASDPPAAPHATGAPNHRKTTTPGERARANGRKPKP